MQRAYSTSVSRFGSCNRQLCLTYFTRFGRALINGMACSPAMSLVVVFRRGGSDSHAGGGGRSPLATLFFRCVLVTLAPRFVQHFLTISLIEGPAPGPA